MTALRALKQDLSITATPAFDPVPALMQIHHGHSVDRATVRKLYAMRYTDYAIDADRCALWSQQRVTCQGYEYLISQGALVAPDVGMAYVRHSRFDEVCYLVTDVLPDGMIQLTDAYGKVSTRRRTFIYEFNYEYDEFSTWEDFDLTEPVHCENCGEFLEVGEGHQSWTGVDTTTFDCSATVDADVQERWNLIVQAGRLPEAFSHRTSVVPAPVFAKVQREAVARLTK